MAFEHHISFAADLTINFGCNWFRIMPEIVFKAFACCHLKLLCC